MAAIGARNFGNIHPGHSLRPVTRGQIFFQIYVQN